MAYRSRDQSKQWVWPSVIVLTIVLALAPPVLSDLLSPIRGIFGLALSPVSRPLYAVSASVKSRMFTEADAVPEDVERLLDELETSRNRNIELRQRNAMLKEQMQRMGVVRAALKDVESELAPANIMGQGRGASSYHYDLNLGSNDGITQGAPVVGGKDLEGPYLLGRIVEVSPSVSVMAAIGEPGTQLAAVITPADITEMDIETLKLQARLFEADEEGFLNTKVADAQPVQIGDLVRLFDHYQHEVGRWPVYIQGWVIGEVVDIRNVPDDRLRKRIIVKTTREHISPNVTIVLPRAPSHVEPTHPTDGHKADPREGGQ